jgi:hypothetical protein
MVGTAGWKVAWRFGARKAALRSADRQARTHSRIGVRGPCPPCRSSKLEAHSAIAIQKLCQKLRRARNKRHATRAPDRTSHPTPCAPWRGCPRRWPARWRGMWPPTPTAPRARRRWRPWLRRSPRATRRSSSWCVAPGHSIATGASPSPPAMPPPTDAPRPRRAALQVISLQEHLTSDDAQTRYRGTLLLAEVRAQSSCRLPAPCTSWALHGRATAPPRHPAGRARGGAGAGAQPPGAAGGLLPVAPRRLVCAAACAGSRARCARPARAAI